MSNELKSSYRAAGFGNALAWGERPALIVIDFVAAYMEPSSPLYASVDDARDRARELLTAARRAAIPVVHTNVEFTPGGVDGGVFFRKLPMLKVFERGSPLCEFARGLEPADGEIVVTKQYASAFFGTTLAATLTSLRVDTLLIAGVTTSGRVRASAVDACQHGFVPVVVRDAVGDRRQEPHEANLFDLEAKYAELAATNVVCEYLEHVSAGE